MRYFSYSRRVGKNGFQAKCSTLFTTVVTILFLVGLVGNLQAQTTYTVTNANDNGGGSLREAMGLANEDSIIFNTIANVITLSTGELSTVFNPHIDGTNGSNPSIVLAASGGSRIFNFTRTDSLAINLNNITLSGAGVTGNGGAIFANIPTESGARLVLNNVILQSNSATNTGGAISYGYPDVAELVGMGITTFDQNAAGTTGQGGALYTSGSLRLNNFGTLTFSANRAGAQGGAIATRESLMVTNTGNLTFTGNIAFGILGKGGAIYTGGNANLGSGVVFGGENAIDGNSAYQGGAVYLDTTATQLSLDDTTFQNNTASDVGGAIYFAAAGQSTLSTSGTTTFSENSSSSAGGAIHASGGGGGLAIDNSGTLTFSGNSGTNGAAIAANGLVITGSGSVLFSGNTATNSGGALWTLDTSMKIGSGVTFDGNSANRGGAIGFSLASPTLEIDGTTFQNNTATEWGGAIYIDNSGLLTLANDGDSKFIGNSAADLGGAIRAVGALTITNSATGTLTFTGNKTTGATGNGGAIIANGNVTIGRGVTFGGVLSTQGNSASQGGAIYLGTGATALSLDGTTFQNNSAIYSGGAISTTASATITGTGTIQFIGNTVTDADGKGGAIYGASALTLTNATDSFTFIGNKATGTSGKGGAIYAGTSVGPLSISNAIFGGSNVADGNSAKEGGAIYTNATQLSLNETIFQNNSVSSTASGAIHFANSGASTLTNTGDTQFISNTGGAIYADGTFTLTNNPNSTVTFANNEAGRGGGITARNPVIGSGVTFSGNSATTGGAIMLAMGSTSLSLDGTTFQNNTASQIGGAIWNAGSNAITLTNTGTTLFSGNRATSGGGAINTAALTILNTGTIDFIGNKSTGSYGGAISAGGNVTIGNDVTFGGTLATDGNSAPSGGAIYLSSIAATTLSLDGTVFQNNTATNNGGAVYFASTNLSTLTNIGDTKFIANSATNSGGAIYAKGNLTVDSGVTFGGTNVADGNSTNSGGAIYLDTAATTLSLDGTIFQNNTANVSGGAVYLANITAETITNIGDTKFIANTATMTGGAIRAGGALTLTNTLGGTLGFTGNKATGAAGQGGAITASGNMTVGSGITFGGANAADGNSAYRGGAIYLDTAATQLSLDGTSFQSNEATNQGAAVYFANTGTSTLTNSGSTSFSNNTATGNGGAIYAVGALSINNTGLLSFADNTAITTGGNAGQGGAIRTGTLAITNTGSLSFANNESRQGGAIYITGTEISLEDTVLEDNTAVFGGAIYMQHLGYPNIVLNYKGDTVFSGNTAKGAAGVSTSGNGGAIWVGAELVLTNNSGTLTFTGNSTDSDGQGGAIFAGNNLTVGSGTTFGGANAADGNSATYGGAIALGASATQLSLDGTIFENNSATANGGALHVNNADFVLANSGNTNFSNNSAVAGGAIYSGNSMSITNTSSLSFTANKADGVGSGGAIFTEGNLTIGSGVTFGGDLATDGNSANQGGAITLAFSVTELTLNGTTFKNNSATDKGGAIFFINPAAPTLTNSGTTKFIANSAGTGAGGAIYSAGALTLANTGLLSFASNQAGTGGAIYSDGNLSIGSGVTFGGDLAAEGNSAEFGGAIYLANTVTQLSLNGTTFQNNDAFSNDGGAIYFANTGTATLTNTGNTSFLDNKAGKGGAIFASGNLTLANDVGAMLTFAHNEETGFAVNGGGGAIFASADLTVGSGIVFGGTALTDGNSAYYGGGIYLYGIDAQLSLNETRFQNNTSQEQGGAIYFRSRSTLTNTGLTSFIGNSATSRGGAIYAGGNLTLTGDGTLAFSGNTATEGGAIYVRNDLTIDTGLALRSDINTAVRATNMILNSGAILEFDLTNAGAATTNLAVTGTVDSVNTVVGLPVWKTGTFTLMTATDGIDYTKFVVDSSSFGSRQLAILSGSATQLILTTSGSGNNLNLAWTGGNDGNWNTTATGNWASGELFNPDDFVTFDNSATTKNVTVGNGTGVQVSGMKIASGNYTFSGNKITGTAPTATSQTVTGKLELATTGTTTMNVETDFIYGTIMSAGTLILGHDKALGVYATNMTTPANSKGQLAISGNATVNINDDRTISNRFVVNSGTLTLDVAAGKSLTIQNVNNTEPGGNGGAILTNGNVSIGNSVTFLNNSTLAEGGAIRSDKDVTIGDSVTFTDNSAGGAGGAILVWNAGNVAIGASATFTSNSADGGGGGAIRATGNLMLGDFAEFTSNSATVAGGAIRCGDSNDHSIVIGDFATFTNNSANETGGAIHNWLGTVSLGDSTTFTLNKAITDGGAIWTNGDGSNVILGDTVTFTGNSANRCGGAIFHSLGAISFGDFATFTGNLAGQSGGAIYSDGDLILGSNVIFDSNKSGGGGAVYVAPGHGLTLNGNTFFKNNKSTSAAGGAVSATTLTLNADIGDIAFTGNAIDSGGTATSNSVYLNGNTTGGIDITGNNNIYFDDPISSGIDGGNSLTKTGNGFVQFVGDNTLNPNGMNGGEVIVSQGVFRVVDGSNFSTGGNDDKKFNLETAGTLAGGGTIGSSNGFVLHGTVSPDADRFEIPTFDTATNRFDAGRTTVTDAKKIGTLSLIGNALLDGATLLYDLGTSNASDKVIVTGTVSHGTTNNTVTLSTWNVGTFTLLSAISGIDYTKFAVDASSFGSRQTVDLSGSATQLILTTSGGNNLDLVWTGSSDGNWNTTATGNWSSGEMFNPDDFVTFDNSATIKDITIGNGNGQGVQVAGMKITGGDYIFSGNKITGSAPTATNQTVTGKLVVSGGSASFRNVLDFVNGIEIQNGATVELADGGTFTDTMTISNAGTLRFNHSAAHAFHANLAGTGSVLKTGLGLLTLDAANMSGNFVQEQGGVELAAGKTWSGNYAQRNTSGVFAAGNGSAISGNANFDGNVDLDGNLNISGNLFLDGAVLAIDLASNNISDSITVGGDVSFGNNINTFSLNNWETGLYTLLSAASIDPIEGKWTMKYGGATVDPTKAQFLFDGTSLKLETDFVAPPERIIVEWDGDITGDPQGMIWDKESVGDGVFVVIDREETQLITIDGELSVLAGMEISTNILIRPARKDDTALIQGEPNPELAGLLGNGQLMIVGGEVDLDVDTDFANGNLLAGGNVKPGRDKTFGTFEQDPDDIENSRGQITVTENAEASISPEKSLNVQNRYIVKDNASLTIDVADGEELIVSGVNVADTSLNQEHLLNGGAIILLPGSTLTLSGNINITGNSTELAGGGIFVDPATLVFDSSKGHTAIYDNEDETGLNAIALEGVGNVLKFVGGSKALSGGVDIRDSVRVLPGSTDNIIDISYTDSNDFVQFGKADHALGAFGRVSVEKGIMRLVEGAAFDAGDGLVDVDSAGILAGGGTFRTTDFSVRGSLSPDAATLTTTSSIIGSDKLVGTMTLEGRAEFDGARIAVELKRNNLSDRIDVQGDLTYDATKNRVDVNSWSEGTFAVLQTMNAADIDENRFSLKFGGEEVGSRQSARLFEEGNFLKIETAMNDADRRRLIWTADADGWLGTASLGNWTDDFGDAERFNHTDYLVFNETGKQGKIILGAADGSVGGRTVSGMLISNGNYNFSGGDLFGVRSVFEYGAGSGMTSEVGGDLIIAGGNVGFENNVYFEGNIEILNQANVTLNGQKAFHTEGDFLLDKNTSLTFDVGDDLIKGRTVTLDGAVHLTNEPLPTTHRSPVYHNMIVATGGGLDTERLQTLFDFTEGLLNRQALTDGTSMSLQYSATPLSEYAAANEFNRNETEIARYFEETFGQWEWEDVELELMEMNDSQLDFLFTRLSNGVIHADAKTMALSNPYRAVSQHFFEADGDTRTIDPRHRRCCCSTSGFWFAAHHSDRRQDGDGQARRYGVSRTGMNLGIDKRITGSFYIGFLLDYSDPRLYQEGSRIEADDTTFGVYARKRFQDIWEANFFLAYGDQDYTGKRLTIDGMARSRYNGDSRYLTAELVRRMALTKEFMFLPTLALDVQSARSDAFAETGSEFRQEFEKSELSQTFIRFGLNSQWRMNDRFRLDTRLQYGRQIGGSDTPSIRSVFGTSSVENPMTLYGVVLGRDRLNVGVGGRYFLTKSKRGSVYGNYDLDRGNRSLAHLGEIGFQFWR